jgi:hypothetical protein
MTMHVANDETDYAPDPAEWQRTKDCVPSVSLPLAATKAGVSERFVRDARRCKRGERRVLESWPQYDWESLQCKE